MATKWRKKDSKLLGKKWELLGIPGNNTCSTLLADQWIIHAMSASVSQSSERVQGRLLHIHFRGEQPLLSEIEFRWNDSANGPRWKRDTDSSEKRRSLDTPLPTALATFFVSFAALAAAGQSTSLFFSDQKQARTILNARESLEPYVHQVFINNNGHSCYSNLFIGPRLSRHSGPKHSQRRNEPQCEREIAFGLNTSVLPADCVEIYWDKYGKNAVKDEQRLKELLNAFRSNRAVVPNARTDGTADYLTL